VLDDNDGRFVIVQQVSASIMPIEQADIMCDRERLQRAQILLDLFEEDCGRAPGTLEEVGVWALENRDHLDTRIEHRTAGMLHRDSEASKQQSDAVFRKWPLRGRNFLHRILA
jgi:hypothetical protein